MTASPSFLPLSDPSSSTVSDHLEDANTAGPTLDSRENNTTAPPVDVPSQRDGSIDPIDGVGVKKRRKRPGWKGYALVIEDEEGNVLELRPRGESPVAENEVSRESSAVVDNGNIRKAKSMSPFIGTRQGITASSSPLVRSQALEKSISSEGMAKKRRRGSSTAREGPSTKSPRVQPISLEPAPSPSTAAPTPPSAIPPHIIPGDHPKASSSGSRVRTTSPTRMASSQAKEDARIAREARTEARSRVSTPITAVVLPDDNPLPRVTRAGMGEDQPRPPESDVRAEGAYLIDAANRRREEERIRDGERQKEEEKVRLLAEKRVQEERARLERDELVDAVDRRPSISGWQPQDEVNGDPRAAPRRFWKGQNGSSTHQPEPVHSNHARSSNPSLPVFYTSNGEPSRSRYSAVFDPSQPMANQSGPPLYANHRQTTSLDDFDTQYAAVQDDFNRRASTSSIGPPPPEAPPVFAQEIALGRGAEDAKPPKFHTGQRPTVVLAPSAPSGRRPRDRVEKEHSDGFDGLTHDVMADCDGFVDNVRENLRNIVTYFLPQPSDRRDAFLERVGRGLVELGWQLTDTGDGALQRDPPREPDPLQPAP